MYVLSFNEPYKGVTNCHQLNTKLNICKTPIVYFKVTCAEYLVYVYKMKEIEKVVQKLSRGQKSAAGDGGGVRTVAKNIKSPPIHRGDLTK